MLKLQARDVLNYDEDTLWALSDDNVPHGGMIQLTMDDGDIIVGVNDTILSWYWWWPQRYWPQVPLLKEHHIQDVQLEAKIPCVYMARTSWLAYDLLGNQNVMQKTPTLYDVGPITLDDDREYLTMQIRQHLCHLYNVMITRLGEWVTTLDALDILDIVDNEEIQQANQRALALNLDDPNELAESEKVINETHNAVGSAITNHPDLDHARFSELVRTKANALKQILQLFSCRGFITELSGEVIPVPIMSGLSHGLTRIYDSAIESLTSSMSLYLNKDRIADVEYFSRQMQINCQVISTLDVDDDCGTSRGALWVIEKEHLGTLAGSWAKRIDSDEWFVIQSHMHELIGVTLKVRNALTCDHPDPASVCGKCYGEARLSVPAYTNIGHYCAAVLCELITQNMLSNKHYTGSATIDEISYKGSDAQYLAPFANQYQVAILKPDDLTSAKLSVEIDQAPRLKDIEHIDQAEDLYPSHFSAMIDVGFEFEEPDGFSSVFLQVARDARKASFSVDMLKYIKEHGYVIEDGMYHIDLAEWDYSLPVWELPRKQGSMVEFQGRVEKFIKNGDSGRHDDTPIDVGTDAEEDLDLTAALIGFYDLVNAKFTFSMFILAVILRSTLARDPDKLDYRLPLKGEKGKLGRFEDNIVYRSLSQAAAYERQHMTMINKRAFMVRDRPPHPNDPILLPNLYKKDQ